MLWDALTVTYSSGKDKLQTFDLHIKANGLKQNGAPLEEFWIVMQGIWGEIERRDPNPMTCPTDIAAYNKIRLATKKEKLARRRPSWAVKRPSTAAVALTPIRKEELETPSTSREVNMATSGKKNDSWIFYCGATDTMAYEISDICAMSKPRISRIHTSNEETLQVEGGGTIQVSQDMKLSNCLYVPSLSHKLLSISHVTKELNCIVLMHPTFCILQDIRTGMIIGVVLNAKGCTMWMK
nr:putative Gag-polypeptide of LTR copia-type [Tanacetum cinerariifolium]